MDEIIPGLWIGDLQSALNVKNLKENGIFSILSAMRGRITIHATFIRHQIQLDDTEDADVLTHLLPAIHFIQAELDKGRGVLVHCQAGVSRSSTIVAAYLMHSRKIDPQAALELIKKARPFIDPNQGFLQQLDLFHSAQYKISRREKAIRMFYMGRAVDEVMNGDGSPSETEMFAQYPRTSSDSPPPSPGLPRRRIRCKMCRQELATREHMLDHGQLGPATPAVPTPSSSRRSSNGSLPQSRPSRLSFSSGLGDTLSMSSIQEDPSKKSEPESIDRSETPRNPLNVSTPASSPLTSLRSMSQSLDQLSASTSALDIEDETDKVFSKPTVAASPPPMQIDLAGTTAEDLSIRASQILGRQLSDAVIATVGDSNRTAQLENKEKSYFTANGSAVNEYPVKLPDTSIKYPTTHLLSPSDLAAQLLTNPKLAALRSPTTPGSANAVGPTQTPPIVSAPILVNPKCSGYFVEPMKWMDHFLSDGQLAGKISCPNKKCGAKLGNYDWAGVCCGCKEWVTPGFCINRSKVDEVL
ncbi:hypothetical protein GALMADRAFT_222955 [Galerina marginata CBS 339.88]|uniref:protein-tyrosine-phosphatase n=1 Tax=Galerina marginata (strain CBS 339.88) TaxID=685588 RepID=A0A067TCI8_GALM3|nr:hypothetical protein GALMADRAFT_222955 [Galerina marginata CBS 339.88]